MPARRRRLSPRSCSRLLGAGAASCHPNAGREPGNRRSTVRGTSARCPAPPLPTARCSTARCPNLCNPSPRCPSTGDRGRADACRDANAGVKRCRRIRARDPRCRTGTRSATSRRCIRAAAASRALGRACGGTGTGPGAAAEASAETRAKDSQFSALGHDPEKWKPVFGQDHAHTINLDRDPT